MTTPAYTRPCARCGATPRYTSPGGNTYSICLRCLRIRGQESNERRERRIEQERLEAALKAAGAEMPSFDMGDA